MINFIEGQTVVVLDGDVLVSEMVFPNGGFGIGFSELKDAAKLYEKPSDDFAGQTTEQLDIKVCLTTDNVKSLQHIQNIISIAITKAKERERKMKKAEKKK